MASLNLTPLSRGAGRSQAGEASWEAAGGSLYSLYCRRYHGFSRIVYLKHIAALLASSTSGSVLERRAYGLA